MQLAEKKNKKNPCNSRIAVSDECALHNGSDGSKFLVLVSIFHFTLYWGLKAVTSFTVSLFPAPALFHTAVAKREDEKSMVV